MCVSHRTQSRVYVTSVCLYDLVRRESATGHRLKSMLLTLLPIKTAVDDAHHFINLERASKE